MVDTIKYLCKENGMSVSGLAEKAGISANSIYKWDVNTPLADKVARVAKVLGVTMDRIYYGADCPDDENRPDISYTKKMLIEVVEGFSEQQAALLLAYLQSMQETKKDNH